MGRKIRKIFAKLSDCADFIFKSPAANQLRVSKTAPGKFGSYSQLKRYQKHFRRVSLEIFVAILFLFIGVLFGPVVLKDQMSHEIYIPDGKGDILIGNISKNQATVIFKTLNSDNDNKPLATSAMVEIYLDPEMKTLFKKTDIFEYAVTHIIPLNGLQEGKFYYLKLVASESESMENSKEVSKWGGSEPISLFTSGEKILACDLTQNVDRTISETGSSVEVPAEIPSDIQFAPSSEVLPSELSFIENEQFKIGIVQNENHLYDKDRVQTIISWQTNLPSDSSLIYRSEKDSNETEIKKDNEFGKKHALILTSLKPDTIYYFKVKSINESGEVAISKEYSMKTPRPKQTVMEMVGGNLKSLVRQIMM